MKALPRGITTAALLKSQLDRGNDYFELLTPFVRRAAASSGKEVIDTPSLRVSISTTCGLDIPLQTIAALLDRLSKRSGSGVRKEGSAFLLTGMPTANIDTAADVTTQFESLGRSFAAFCSNHLPSVCDEMDALALLSHFLESHSVTLVLDGAPPQAKTGRREDIVVAQFVSNALSVNGPDGMAVLSLLQGLVLAKAVTLEDLAEVQRKLSNLVVYFDTSFVLALAGLYGQPDHDASKDTVRLLKELGATPAVFDATIAETRRILAVYEDLLDTAEGRSRLYATPVTAYLLAQNARGTDVRTHSELLTRTLVSEGMIVHETPPRVAEFVADEPGLAAALQDIRGPGHESREKHDLDCVAAVLTLRRGRAPTKLEDAGAVFAAVGMVVRTTQRWWDTSGAKGLCPIIDLAALLNYCWLKRPTVATRTHRYELAALCTATLHPSEEAWSAFRGELKKLVADRRITSDEASVILIDSYSSKLLVEAEATESISPISAAAIVDRVREEMRREIASAQAETLREREARNSALAAAAAQRSMDLEAQAVAFSARLDQVGKVLSVEQEQRQVLEQSVVGLARVLAWIVAVPLAALLVALVTIVVAFPVISGLSLTPLARTLLQDAAIIIGVAGGAFGVTAISVGKQFHRWLESRIRRALLRGDDSKGQRQKRLPSEP